MLCQTSNRSILARVRSKILMFGSLDAWKNHIFAVRVRSMLGKYARKCSPSIFEHFLSCFFAVTLYTSRLILNLHRNDIGFYKKKMAKNFLQNFFFINFDQNNVRCSLDTRILMLVPLDVRMSNIRKCSCSKMLENPRSYSLDTRKIGVRHNTIFG